VRGKLEPIAREAVVGALHAQWGLHVTQVDYLAVGAGAYHWDVRSADGRRWFVTCDDLQTKPWFGVQHDAVFAGLRCAYRTAMALRRAGLEFVVAPEPSASGEAAERVDERHSLSVLPYVDGAAGEWGGHADRRRRQEVVTMLARLHQTEAPASTPHRAFALPGRADLEAALGDIGQRWDSGPFAEAGRHELLAGEDAAHDMLADFDHAVDRFASDDAPAVVTHGEPHPVNTVETPNGLVLIDWDTVGVAHRERDLWMIADDEALAIYARLTGVAIDPAAVAAYRVLWSLADLAAYTQQLRDRHSGDADDEFAVAAIRSIVTGSEPAPYG
jgi:spectinomycin phosphotransferase